MAGEGRGEERQEDTEQKRRCPASLSRWLCSVPAGSRRIRDSFRIPVRVPADSRAPAQFLPEALGGPRPRAQEKALGGAPGCAACGGGGAGERGALVGPPGVALSPSDTGSSFGESLGSAGAAPRGQTSPGGTGVQQVGGPGAACIHPQRAPQQRDSRVPPRQTQCWAHGHTHGPLHVLAARGTPTLRQTGRGAQSFYSALSLAPAFRGSPPPHPRQNSGPNRRGSAGGGMELIRRGVGQRGPAPTRDTPGTSPCPLPPPGARL